MTIKSMSLASIAATTLLVGCAPPQLRANWYLYQPGQPTGSSEGTPQRTPQTSSNDSPAKVLSAPTSSEGTLDTLYLALLNQGLETLHLERICIDGLNTSYADIDLPVGQLYVIDLGDFSCRLPTRLEVKEKGRRPFDIELAGPLPSSLPGADAPRCLADDPDAPRKPDVAASCMRASDP